MEENLRNNQDAARQLLEEGGTLLILGAPRGTEFGIDLKSWCTDGDFRGLKMIPPGLHYVHYSASSLESGGAAPRVGFMHNFKTKEMLVKTWDKEKEDLSNEVVPEETLQRFRTNLYNLDKFLGPYPFDILQKWKNLTLNITDNLVEKLTPENGQIRSALELECCNDSDRPKGEKKIKKESVTIEASESEDSVKKDDAICSTSNEDRIIEESNILTAESKNRLSKRRSRTLTLEEKEEELLPNLKPTPGTSIRFSEFPERIYPVNATPAEITKHHLDQSYVLDLMIKRYSRPMEIVGELQFAYVCFLVGHSLDAFEHWKKLVNLFCSCETALSIYRAVYLQFIITLELQLMEVPEEFLADIVMNENVIYVALRKLFITVYNCKIDDRLKTSIERLQFTLTEKFMWNFGDLDVEEDDELPVIVHL